MIVVPPPGSLDERLLPLLQEWLPARRWFPAKGVEAATSLVGAVPLRATGQDGPDEHARIVLVRVRAGSVDVVLQVPLVLRGVPAGPTTGHATDTATDLVGTVTHGSRTWQVLDGAAHPTFVRGWLAAADGPGDQRLDPETASAVTGEQSNTSVVLHGTGTGTGTGAILKVLRALAPGENPDVDVPRRLVEAGWRSVPQPLAWLEAQWADREPDRSAHGYLGVMSAFVDDAEDGFELACSHAAAGRPFADEARELGEVVAGMHRALVRAYGTDPDHVGAAGPAEVARSLQQRYAWALSAVPSLAPYRPGVEDVVTAVLALPDAPPRQRVHGDLHLGQVLRSHGRWFVTDFEGEPLAPLELRTRPDLAVRDVAGLLRSLDYAAAVGGLTGAEATAWADAARDALLDGYRSARAARSASTDGVTTPSSAPDPGAYSAATETAALDSTPRPAPSPATPGRAETTETTLLRALELDKTLYEVVYESRNRPTWVTIPLAGLDRLTGHPQPDA